MQKPNFYSRDIPSGEPCRLGHCKLRGCDFSCHDDWALVFTGGMMFNLVVIYSTFSLSTPFPLSLVPLPPAPALSDPWPSCSNQETRQVGAQALPHIGHLVKRWSSIPHLRNVALPTH